MLVGAGIVLVLYGVLGGRVWCSWVCPINMVTDLAGWLRIRLGIRDMFHLNRNIRYSVLALALLLSALTGVAAFEWVSPISMLHRELIFGLGLGWTAVLGVFLFDLLVLKHGWCGHLCPLGAFYALVGRLAPVRVRFRHTDLHSLRRVRPGLPGTTGTESQTGGNCGHDHFGRVYQLRSLHYGLPGRHAAF